MDTWQKLERELLNEHEINSMLNRYMKEVQYKCGMMHAISTWKPSTSVFSFNKIYLVSLIIIKNNKLFNNI